MILILTAPRTHVATHTHTHTHHTHTTHTHTTHTHTHHTHTHTHHTQTEGELEVAVKVFDQPDTGQHDISTEIIRSYSDMRYELNKLSLLKHPYIARFIGVLTNPHSFVLEWAPEKSLEHIRAAHAHHESPICAASLFQTLVQVSL